MSSKVLVLFAVLCLLGSCCGVEDSTQRLTRHEDIPIEPLGVPSDPDTSQDATFWRFWRFWKWGQSMIKNVFKHSSNMAESASGRHRIHEDKGTGNKRKLKNKKMFYVDSQCTVSRRDSSLVAPSRRLSHDDPLIEIPTAYGSYPITSPHLISDSGAYVPPRPKGSVRKEIITLLFESMLDFIIESWEVIVQQKAEESTTQVAKTPSDTTLSGGKKKKHVVQKLSKTKATKSRSKMDFVDSSQIVWWSAPDEKAIIYFKNGNIFQGNISMKLMNGEGRFQWADGTVYMGEFKDNAIVGKGTIEWKDNTWYCGDFVGNLRHGKGLYVDSRGQRSYTGGWHCGTKHGKGAIYYSKTCKNYYDGDWVFNVRHGFGTREYCQMSGYQGEYEHYVREGKGLMVWSNHDVYKGEWKNGTMSGYGFYIWDACYNHSMSLPSINAYRGLWLKGKRNGYGILNLGLGLGSHYKGEFKDDKKHGPGKFVTNNGLIIYDENLFTDDVYKPVIIDYTIRSNRRLMHSMPSVHHTFSFELCDSAVGLRYHIKEAVKNLDRQEEIRAGIINKYLENNRDYDLDITLTSIEQIEGRISNAITEDLIEFETDALNKALRNYEIEIKHIYYSYATICNNEPISFTPVLIRLFMWQFYYDCNVHEKGLTLVEIDEIYCNNPRWLARTKHGPFDKVYLWQFLHCLVAISSRLYAKRCLPGPRPETVVASAFTYFMVYDAIPNIGACKGYLTQGFGSFVPLKALYRLYCALGEPHSLRTFLCAVRVSPLMYMDEPQPDLFELEDECLPIGCNSYIFADSMTFLRKYQKAKCEDIDEREYLKLFNFGNLSSRAIIKIFARIFPEVYINGCIMNLEKEITFFEFFEFFIACNEESIQVKEEEIIWRQMFVTTPEPPPAPEQMDAAAQAAPPRLAAHNQPKPAK